MKEYTIYFKDDETGAISPIDNIIAHDGYTATDYINDCDENSDKSWCEMLAHGTVIIEG